MTWLLFLLGAALAGVPVVATDEALAGARAAVAARTGLPAEQLDEVSIRKLLEGPPQILGEAVLRRCTSPAQPMEAARAEQMRAEAAWQRRDRLAATDHLDLAVSRLGCLSERVDAASAARVFLLRGALAAEAGDLETAKSELATALAFQPRLDWDPDLPPGGQALFEEQRAGQLAIELRVLPGGQISGPWVDGQALEGSATSIRVAPGLHLAQHTTPAGIRSAWLAVGGDSTLVVPGAYRSSALGELGPEASRQPVVALLQASFPGAPAAYVLEGGRMWLVTFGPPASVELLLDGAPATLRPPKGKKARKAGRG